MVKMLDSVPVEGRAARQFRRVTQRQEPIGRSVAWTRPESRWFWKRQPVTMSEGWLKANAREDRPGFDGPCWVWPLKD